MPRGDRSWIFAAAWALVALAIATNAWVLPASSVVAHAEEAKYADLVRQGIPLRIQPPAEDAVRVLSQDPLSEWPFVSQAAVMLSDSKPEEASALLKIALRRNPRNTTALALALQLALIENRSGDAFELLDNYLRVDPERYPILRSLAIDLVERDTARDTFKEILLRNPPWVRDVIVALNQTSRNYELVADLDRLAPEHQRHFLERLIKERGAQAAYMVWLEYAGIDLSAPTSWPFNPTFARSNSPAPFNWTYDKGAAQYVEDGAQVLNAGLKKPILSQVVLLRPGAYHFKARMTSEQPDAFSWRVACLESSAALGSMQTSSIKRTEGDIWFAFQIPPSGCEAQLIELIALPATVSSEAIVQSVAIQAVRD